LNHAPFPLVCTAILLGACAVPPIPTPFPPADPHAWTLVWSDEFNGPAGSAPDPSKWNYDLGGGGWGNQEWEYYTDKPENAALDGEGNLAITARQVEYPPAGSLNCWYGPCKFTSARLHTEGKFDFTYGRLEARIRLPSGQGLWPAFWMVGNNYKNKGWPYCGELDVMENVGSDSAMVFGTAHGPGYSGGRGITYYYTLPDGDLFSDDFHVFALEWEAEELRWYADSNLYGTLHITDLSHKKPWVFNHPFIIILNVAVGGGLPGDPDATTSFPQVMTIDYVRVYQK